MTQILFICLFNTFDDCRPSKAIYFAVWTQIKWPRICKTTKPQTENSLQKQLINAHNFISLHANDSYTIGLCLSTQRMIAWNFAWHSEPFTLFRIFRHFNKLHAEQRVYFSYNKLATSLAGLNPLWLRRVCYVCHSTTKHRISRVATCSILVSRQ